MEFLGKKWIHFLVLAKDRKISAAAKKLGITAAALSLSVKGLEEELGGHLFERSRRGVELTGLGNGFYKMLVEEEASLRASFEKIQGGAGMGSSRGGFKIGIVTHVSWPFIQGHLSAFEEKFGSNQYYIGYSLKILEEVKSGGLDFGFIGWTKHPREIAYEYLFSDPVAIVGEKKRFAHIQKTNLTSELRDETWIWHRMPQKSPSEYLMRDGNCFVVDDYATLKRLLFAGEGIAEVQLGCFTAAELKRLTISRAPPTQRVGIYAIHRASLGIRAMLALAELKRVLTKLNVS